MTPDMIAQGLCAVMTVAAVIYREPLFPGLSPLAVGIGLCVTIGPLWVWWNADNGLGNCEGWILREERADEAARWLRRMENRRVA